MTRGIQLIEREIEILRKTYEHVIKYHNYTRSSEKGLNEGEKAVDRIKKYIIELEKDKAILINIHKGTL